ncbi:hypothetical protein [Sphingobium sp.]|uniref:hypothetical protein n=1 Tax=Sphingobium sp. TaxID=1912891 RepID=UPI00258080D4|nr:hypothetical protein [Sphingobium sp.]
MFGGRNQPIDARHLLLYRQTVIGCLLGPVMGDPNVNARIGNLLQPALYGELGVPIDATFTLAETAAARRRAEEGGRIGCVIMLP